MKWEKVKLFQEKIPQTKWEAYYLIEKEKTDNVFSFICTFLILSGLLIIAWVGVSLFSQTCEFQLDGKALGEGQILGNANFILESSNLKELNITSIEGKVEAKGKIKVKMPCVWISKITGN